MRKFLRDHGLSLTLIGLFVLFWAGGQIVSGRLALNEERSDFGEPPLSLPEYLRSPHFAEATFENWESEFLQMFLYIWLTAFLYERGSAESNDPDEPQQVDPITGESPWAARQTGIVHWLYAHSLSLTFAALFLVSFLFHSWSSWHLENEDRLRFHQAPLSYRGHIGGAKFWFESFQNWQSEFLAIASMVLLSVYLRERNSPESKRVGAPHRETGA